MPGAETLQGEFVSLRPLRADDAAVTLRWRSGRRAELLNEGARTVEAQAAWIERRPASDHDFVIELRGGTAVGMLSLIDVDRANRRAESARFLIGEEAAVRGVPAAVEAMKLLYGLAFDGLGLHRVWGTVAAGNRRMIKWQRYLGMQEEGRLRAHLHLGGAWQDAVCVGLLEPEYRAVALPRMDALIAAGRARSPA